MRRSGGLNVWMNGVLVGHWQVSRGGTHVFQYDHDWVSAPEYRQLSLSLPMTSDADVSGPEVEAYFDNLLPDPPEIRQRLALRFTTKSTNAFDLLSVIGRDCVGAVQTLPPDETPEGYNRLEYEEVDDKRIEHILASVTSRSPLGSPDAGDDFRISIAGAQEKTALLKVGGQWCTPKGATPTTHILKLPLGALGGRLNLDMSNSVENEWLCSRILRALKLDIAETEVLTFGAQKVLVVERFDRRWAEAGDWILRIPQEDFCQATGTPTARKYEADGGPGLEQCMAILGGSRDPNADLIKFLRTQVAFWLLAATDGHAKNFSIFNLAGDEYALTPLYDVLSAWPVIGHGDRLLPLQSVKMAMAVRSKNVHYHLAEIKARHWKMLAQRSGADGAWAWIMSMVTSVDSALETVEKELPADFPVVLWETVRDGVRGQAAAFLKDVPA